LFTSCEMVYNSLVFTFIPCKVLYVSHCISERVCILFLPSPGFLDSLPVPSDFSLCLSPYLILFLLFVCLCMTLAWILITIVDNPLNKYCIWILNLRVWEQFVTIIITLFKIDCDFHYFHELCWSLPDSLSLKSWLYWAINRSSSLAIEIENWQSFFVTITTS